MMLYPVVKGRTHSSSVVRNMAISVDVVIARIVADSGRIFVHHVTSLLLLLRFMISVREHGVITTLGISVAPCVHMMSCVTK